MKTLLANLLARKLFAVVLLLLLFFFISTVLKCLQFFHTCSFFNLHIWEISWNFLSSFTLFWLISVDRLLKHKIGKTIWGISLYHNAVIFVAFFCRIISSRGLCANIHQPLFWQLVFLVPGSICLFSIFWEDCVCYLVDKDFFLSCGLH